MGSGLYIWIWFGLLCILEGSLHGDLHLFGLDILIFVFGAVFFLEIFEKPFIRDTKYTCYSIVNRVGMVHSFIYLRFYVTFNTVTGDITTVGFVGKVNNEYFT